MEFGGVGGRTVVGVSIGALWCGFACLLLSVSQSVFLSFCLSVSLSLCPPSLPPSVPNLAESGRVILPTTRSLLLVCEVELLQHALERAVFFLQLSHGLHILQGACLRCIQLCAATSGLKRAGEEKGTFENDQGM